MGVRRCEIGYTRRVQEAFVRSVESLRVRDSTRGRSSPEEDHTSEAARDEMRGAVLILAVPLLVAGRPFS